MKRALLTVLLWNALNVQAMEAPDRPFFVEHYDAALSLDFGRLSISGTETIRLRSREVLAEIELDADEIVVESVRVGTAEQWFRQEVDEVTGQGHLRIRLNRPLFNGNDLQVRVTFHGSPAKGLLFLGDTAYTVYNTSHWLVVNHRPDDLATLTLSLDVPARMVVVANGRNLASKKNGDRLLSEWNETRAIPDFVFGFAVGPFTQTKARLGKTELRYLSTSYTPAQLGRIFRATPIALQLFSEKAGVPYPSSTYSEILVTGKPEQELGDFTLLPENYGETLLKRPEEEWLLAHELAHQWWGIGVACRDWSEFWLNEGVATFMADVFLGERYGPARYQHEIEIAQKIYDGLRSSGKDHPLCYRDRNSEKEVGGRLPYFKGALVLHLLKERLGDDVFWSGFKRYTREKWGKTATSKDLQTAMEKAAGYPLTSFFEMWVYQ